MAVSPAVAATIAVTLQVALPALLLAGAALVTLDRLLLAHAVDPQRKALVDAKVKDILTVMLGVTTGVSFAPLVGATAVLPGVATFAVAAILSAVLVGQAASFRDQWRPGLDLTTLGLVAASAAVAPLGWSLVAGTTLSAAVGTSLAVGCLVLSGLLLHAYGLSTQGLNLYTPYADAHVVNPSVVRAHRARPQRPPTVHNLPVQLGAKLSQIIACRRHDLEGRPYVLGIPIILLDGPPGVGKTSLGYAIAEALDADLLRASAATLGRVALPNYDASVSRLRTLFGQAELRSLRTGRLQVVFIDEVAAVLGRKLDLTLGDGFAHAMALGVLGAMLAVQNGRRSGVVFVLADEDLLACRDALLAISPQAPIRVAPPTRVQLHAIFADALERMWQDFARDWGVADEAPNAEATAFAALHDQVAALAELGAVGRHATGIVSRMRRAAEGALGRTPHLREDAAGLRALMCEAGVRAVAWYADVQRRATVQPQLPPSQLQDHQVVADHLYRTVRQLFEDPFSAVFTAAKAQAATNINAEQAVDFANIDRSAYVTLTNILSRVYLDGRSFLDYTTRVTRHAEQRWHSAHDPLVSAAWRDVSSWDSYPEDDEALGKEARALLSTAGGVNHALAQIEARQHDPMACFTDVTLLPYPLCMGHLTGPRLPQMPRSRHVSPYEKISPLLRYYIMLRQRQDGHRRDNYRSENVLMVPRASKA